MLLEMRAQIDADFEADEEQQGPERRMKHLDQQSAENDGDMQHENTVVRRMHKNLGSGLLKFSLSQVVPEEREQVAGGERAERRPQRKLHDRVARGIEGPQAINKCLVRFTAEQGKHKQAVYGGKQLWIQPVDATH